MKLNLIYGVFNVILSFSYGVGLNWYNPLIREKVIQNKPEINHKDVLNTAKLNIFMYDYGKKFELEKNETIKDFIKKKYSDLNRISEIRREILINISKTSPYGEVKTFISNNISDIQCGITLSETNKRITVVFRGSESLTDWINNMQMNKRELNKDVWVHNGYHKILHDNEVYNRLIMTLNRILKNHENYDIFVTGHSAGGGIASIFGYELSKILNNTISVITFGSPRIGNLHFRENIKNSDNLKIYRITNKRDVVTALPFFFNYYHVGDVIHLKNKKMVMYYDNYTYPYYFYSLFNRNSIVDHDMINYYLNIKDNIW